MYDNTCKFLAENFPEDFARWLLGKPIALTKIAPSELASEPIRADSIIFLESSEIVLHLEFQTQTDETMPYRMANYWLRLYGKYPDKEIYQCVIYLKPSKSPLAYQTRFTSRQLNHKFNVIRLWEQPTDIFRQYIGLLPLAVLTKTNDPQSTLRDVAQQIEDIVDKEVKNNLAASTAIISGIVLNRKIIQRLIRSEIMRESVIYQDILLEGEARGRLLGKAEGKAEGKVETKRQIALNMLGANVSTELVTQFTGLTLKQVQQLQKLSQKRPSNK
jgi:predicted transposase/invertase (TIGR01784 family)